MLVNFLSAGFLNIKNLKLDPPPSCGHTGSIWEGLVLKIRVPFSVALSPGATQEVGGSLSHPPGQEEAQMGPGPCLLLSGRNIT